jgi:hypothetical protein
MVGRVLEQGWSISAPRVVANRTDERAIEAIAALRRLRFTGPTHRPDTNTREGAGTDFLWIHVDSCGFVWIRVDLCAFVFD